MKAVALLTIVGGWVIAMGGLVAVDATAPRMVMALVGLATSIAGVFTLNGAHLKNAPWKARGH